MNLLAEREPDLLAPFIEQLVDALYRPEAQTRWAVLDALTRRGPAHATVCGAATVGAAAALFDEISPPLRLSAFRFLGGWGATARRRSEKVWPILDEAIQCYHGDLEYREMLALLCSFAHGQISGSVAAALAGRLACERWSSASSSTTRRRRYAPRRAMPRTKTRSNSWPTTLY